ncbi:DUF881 domain-containing protein [Planomicrobium sp. YIM 101495]|uniref:DUF881 domain-containing protein n=1 Tax=Planomicrobium sp. YIM 101495 TaxID=2665160 RepID=UPI0013F8E04C|nr:DUF881 domain-containing protein [Planomicrobium sp. YIM 101495]
MKQLKNSRTQTPNKKKSRKSILFTIAFIVLGFILAYSYNLSGSGSDEEEYTGGEYFGQEEYFREQLIEQQERNKELREELQDKQALVQEYEQDFSENEEDFANYALEAEQLRLWLGDMPIQGEGLRVVLNDADYGTGNLNPNDFIVHEGHIFQVINELNISGAQAIAINGQRIDGNSYIVCTGPVITVDGIQHPAPFIIEAIGKADVLAAAMQLNGGVLDQLVNDNLVVTLEQSQTISMPALLTES